MLRVYPPRELTTDGPPLLLAARRLPPAASDAATWPLAPRVSPPSREGGLENTSCARPQVSLTRGRTPSPPNEHAIGPPLLPTSVLVPLLSDSAGDRPIDGSNVVLNAHKPPGKKKNSRLLLGRVPKTSRQPATQSAPPAAVTGQTLTHDLSQGSEIPATDHSRVQEIDSSDGTGDDEEVCALLPLGGASSAQSEERLPLLSSSPLLELTWPSDQQPSLAEVTRLRKAKKAAIGPRKRALLRSCCLAPSQ